MSPDPILFVGGSGIVGPVCSGHADLRLMAGAVPWANEPQDVVDIFRVEGGKLAEHWDVLQNEVPVTAGVAGLSMFDPHEGARRAILESA